MKQQEKEVGIFLDPKQSFNLTLWILDVYTAAIYPFIRAGQGIRAFGIGTALAFCGIYGYAHFMRSGVMLLYWYAWMAFVLFRKLLPDRTQKTPFRGSPWLANWMTFRLLPYEWVLFIEPMVVILVAWLLKDWSRALYKFLLGGALCIGIHTRIGAEFRRREREAIHDAGIDAMRVRGY